MIANSSTQALTQNETQQRLRRVSPPTDIWEEKGEFHVVMEMPGVHKDNVSVEVKEGVLTVRATPRIYGSTDLMPVYLESVPVEFYREFTLGPEIDHQPAEAKLENGLLKLRFNPTEHGKVHKVKII